MYYCIDSKGYKHNVNGGEKIDLGISPRQLFVTDQWVIFNDQLNNDYLTKMKLDGSGKTVILASSAYDLSIACDWVYYNDGRTKAMYRIRIDGSQKEQIR